ncbi:lipocalin family protein [Mucilaginibacter aurantiaciroseus]|uniref:lipocalin family protein n=1 Tax=Mucilaginibacter aurantiaciroseus TaxID=2949308 RepID=UPI0035192DB8
MNLRILLLALLFAVCFAACKKDDKAASVSIEGKWYLTALKLSTFKNGVEYVGTDARSDGFKAEYYFTFDDNNSGVEHSPDSYFSYMPFTYSLSNSVLMVKPSLHIVNHNKFTINKLSDSDMTLTVKITNADKSYSLIVLTLSQTRPAGY